MRNNPDYYRINSQDTLDTIVSIVENNNLSIKESILLFNTLKYLVRFNNKGGYHDLVKAKDYLERMMEVYEKEDEKEWKH